MKNVTNYFLKGLISSLLLMSFNFSIGQTVTDAGILEIHSPLTNYNEGDTVDVLVEFKNFGTDSIFSLDLAYELNLGTPVLQSWTGSLAPGETDSVNLPYVIIPVGNSELCIFTIYASDSFPSNDTMCVSIYGNPQNNAGVNDIVQTPEIEGSYPIYTIIFNQGTLPLESAIIEWSLDTNMQTSINWSGFLDQGNMSDPVLLGYYNFSDTIYNILINTSMPNGVADLENSNDTLSLQIEFFGNQLVDTFPYCESFEVTYDNWLQSTWDDFDWTQNSNGTPSNNTGPSAAFDGDYYMFTEGSNPQGPGDIASLEAMFDFTNFLYPEIVFNYHMFGNNMGTLHLDVFDTIWHNDVWVLSGNQNNQWNQANIGLLEFGGMEQVVIRFRGERGNGARSDMAIDNFCFSEIIANDVGITVFNEGVEYLCSSANHNLSIEIENFGAVTQSNIPLEFIITDPLGNTVTILDTVTTSLPGLSSALFTFSNVSLITPGVYDITCISHLTGDTLTANDTIIASLGVTMSISTFPFTENFETGNNTLKLASEYNAAIGIATDTILNNSFLRLTGGDSNQGWSGTGTNVTPENAWVDNVVHHATALTCEIDATNMLGLMLDFDLLQTNTFDYTDYCWFRVLINDTIQIEDVNGISNFNASTPINDPFHTVSFNLSQFAGTTFTLTLQGSLKYNESYNSGYPDGDQVLIDNISLYEPFALDAMIVNILDIGNSICGNANQYFTVEVANNGVSDINAFDVSVVVSTSSGFVTLTETITDTLSNGDMTTIMVGPFDMSIADYYMITATSMLTGDGNAANDMVSTTVSTLSDISSFPFIEEFTTANTDYFGFEFNSLATVYFFEDNTDYVLRMEGGPTNAGWSGSGNNTLPAQAWTNVDHFGWANSCNIDATSMQYLNLDIDFRQTGIVNYINYSWFRVLVNDSIQLTDINGDMDFHPIQPQGDPYQLHTFNLNAFAGTEFTLTLQSSCKYDSTLVSGGTPYPEGDAVYIRHISLYAPPPIDILVTGIDGIPEPDCDLGSAQITVFFMNNGTDTLFAGNGATFNLMINSGTTLTEFSTFATDLAYGDTASHTFNMGYDLSMDGDYNFEAWCNYLPDTITSNNYAYGFTTNILTVTSLPYEEDFESTSPGWYKETINGNTEWELGTPQQTNINSAHSGIGAWMTDLDANYDDDAEMYLYSPCFDFTMVANPYISVWLNVDSEEDYDGMVLEGSTNNGTSWFKVGESSLFFYNSFNNAAGNPVIENPWWTATYGSWTKFSTTANEYAGAPNVKFRFRFESDGSQVQEGVAIDDFSIVDLIIVDVTASDTTICIGHSATLDIAISGGIPPYSVEWSPAGSLDDPLSSNPIATPTSTTLYDVIVTDSFGTQGTGSIVIEVNMLPIVELGPDIQSATPVNLDAGSGFTYLWSTGETTQIITVSENGIYSVTVTDNNGCEGFDEIQVDIDNAIDGIDNDEIVSIYPNPANDKVFVELLSDMGDIQLSLSDITGKIINISKIETGDNMLEMDVSNLASGTYVITISTINYTIVRKLFVE